MSDKQIKASICSECSKVVVPPRDICPYCRSGKSTPRIINLRNEGIVLTFTELHIPPEGFESPLKLALVELEHNAVVLCLQEDEIDSDISIGNQVTLTYDDELRLRFRVI
ncbi:MAG: zinc ribbon domain-containing protein [Candidatus Thorarchaeota archaeon]